MSFDDPELVQSFVEESLEHLADIEQELLQIEQQGCEADAELVNRVFRAIHSVKGAAGFLGLTQINQLAHAAENVLDQIRNHRLTPSPEVTDVLLRASDLLREMIQNVEQSQHYDIAQLVHQLHQVAQGSPTPGTDPPAEEAAASLSDSSPGASRAAGKDAKDAPEPGESAPAAGASSPSPAACQGLENSPAGRNGSSAVEATLRVPVGVLDRLMNLAGELVLSRNQLLQTLDTSLVQGTGAIVAGLDRVTSELQEAVMQTRLQPVGNVLNRFPRVVRDLARKLGKRCRLTITGQEVEVDKSILEAITDPLTHLVRNALDHGIEPPQQRQAAGKPPEGHLELRAYHQAGKVCLDVIDDGRGIDPQKLRQKAIARGLLTPEQAQALSPREALQLIFTPGFSTAEQVTDVSGRGVGMDVVRSNIQRLGGTVEVESQVGQGTTVHITLPLTLAIIPSLVVRCGGQRFAIPQVNIVELVRVRPQERTTRIGQVKGAQVLRLRGSLLPLLDLAQVLGQSRPNPTPPPDQPVHVIVVESTSQRYGLVVDALEDSQEIVVKPLGQHLKGCACLAGATILGDGHVALILDVASIAAWAQLRSPQEASEEETTSPGEKASALAHDTQTMLIFTHGPEEYFAVSMGLVARIERVQRDQIRQVGGQQVLQYRESTLPLLALEEVLPVAPAPPSSRMYVVVFRLGRQEVGLLVPQLCDVEEVPLEVDTTTFAQPGVMGSVVLQGRTVRLLDIGELARSAHPHWFASSQVQAAPEDASAWRLLVVEDSKFFRNKVKDFLQQAGYQVVECEDGQQAWEWLQSGQEVHLVLTDVEMPRMDGLELCRRIKTDPQLSHLPVVALTSLATHEDQERGQQAGMDAYLVKMDREQLLQTVGQLLRQAPQPQLVEVEG